jgi:hypothetical protein
MVMSAALMGCGYRTTVGSLSVIHLKRRAIFGPRLAVIVDAGGGDVGVAEPFLDLGDVGLMVERVGGGGRAQRVGADLEPQLCRIRFDQLVDRAGRERAREGLGKADWLGLCMTRPEATRIALSLRCRLMSAWRSIRLLRGLGETARGFLRARFVHAHR